MKTTSLKRSKKQGGVARNRVALVFIVCFVLAATQWLFPSVLFRVVYVVSMPFTSIRNFVGGEFSSVGSYFASKESLTSENAQLKNDISAINIKLLSMEALQSELASLQSMVAAKQEKNPLKASQTVFAAVTARPPFSPYDTLVISSGANFGITAGNPVFSDDGVPIGAVENVFPTSSKVLLFSSPGTEISVVVGNKKFETTASGEGGGDFGVKIPVENAPQKGDAVYIPEFSPLAIGVVENVATEPSSAFAEVSFAYPENIFEMSFVTVDTSSHFQINLSSYEATSTAQ